MPSVGIEFVHGRFSCETEKGPLFSGTCSDRKSIEIYLRCCSGGFPADRGAERDEY